MRLTFRSLSDLLNGPPPPDSQVFEEDGATAAVIPCLAPTRVFQVSEVSKDYEIVGWRHHCGMQKASASFAFVDRDGLRPGDRGRPEATLWMTLSNEELHSFPGRHVADRTVLQCVARARSEEERIAFCGVAKDAPPTTELFYDDCHFNEGGARRIAELLSACMVPAIRSKLEEWNDKKN